LFHGSWKKGKKQTQDEKKNEYKTAETVSTTATAAGIGVEVTESVIDLAKKYSNDIKNGNTDVASLKLLGRGLSKVGRVLGAVSAAADLEKAIDEGGTENWTKAGVSVSLLFIRINPGYGVLIGIGDVTHVNDKIIKGAVNIGSASGNGIMQSIENMRANMEADYNKFINSLHQ